MFLVTATTTPTAEPGWEEVETLIKCFVLYLAEVFTERVFKKLLYSVVTLFEVAMYYRRILVAVRMLKMNGMSAEDKNNDTIIIHVFVARVLGCDTKMIKEFVGLYKSSRRLPNVIRRLLCSFSAPQLKSVVFVKIKRNPHEVSTKDYSDSKKSTNVFSNFKDSNVTSDVNQTDKATF